MPTTQNKWHYGIVLDAGSSGTRLHVYRWPRKHASPNLLPSLETKKKWTTKIRPGISTFGEKPDLVGPKYLKEILHKAKEIIPGHQAAETPLFLLATAGVRLLPESQQETLLREVCKYARKHTKFAVPDCTLHIQAIPGDTEGLYGWIAANYLLDGFITSNTFGFLDMGGASAQIAFAPNKTETQRHLNDLTLLRLRTNDGHAKEYQVFTTTWLGFGVNEARRRYVEALQKQSSNATSSTFLDPCLPPGLSVTPTGDIFLPDSHTVEKGKVPIMAGTGEFDACLHRTLPLLDKEHICVDEPCLLGGVHVPAIDFHENHFVGVSEYWHTTHGIFEVDAKDKAYEFNTYQTRVRDFCMRNWTSIEQDIERHKWGDKVDERTAVEVCFKASWLINVLHEGIGIPRVGLEPTPNTPQLVPSFQAVNKINDTEVSWTLGKMLLYACSQIPSNEGLVGYGSESDFHQPAVVRSSPNQGPGLFIFCFILVTFLFLQRKRLLAFFQRDRRGVYKEIEAGTFELDEADSSDSSSASKSRPRQRTPLAP